MNSVIAEAVPETDRPGRRFRVRGIGIAIVLVLGALVAAAHLLNSLRNQDAEYVSSKVPPHRAFADEGKLYGLDIKPDSLTIRSISLSDGSEREVLRRSSIGRNEIHYVGSSEGRMFFVQTQQSANALRGSTAGGGMSPPTYLGTFLESDGRKFEAGTTRKVSTWTPARAMPEVLFAVSLPHGRVQAMKIDIEGNSLQSVSPVFRGETVYWVRPGSRKSTTVRRGETYWGEFPADCDLMASPLNGRPPKLLVKGLTSQNYLQGAEGFLFWSQLRPFPDKSIERHYFRLSDGKYGVIPDRSGNRFPSNVTVCNGKLYWMLARESTGAARHTIRPTPGRTRATFIMELDPDSGNAREAADLSASPFILDAATPLQSHRGTLYAIMSRVEAEPSYDPATGYYGGGDSEAGGSFLVRIQPGASNPLVSTRKLPRGMQLNWLVGDHIYFVASEIRSSPFDFLLPLSSSRLETALYRIQLP